MYITLIYAILICYYVIFPVGVGLLLPDAREILFICQTCASPIDSISFLFYIISATFFSVIILWISEKKNSPILLQNTSDPAIEFLTKLYLVCGSLMVIFLAPIDISGYMDNEVSTISKLLYTVTQIFLAPSIFMLLSGRVKIRKLYLIIAIIALVLMIARLKRLEVFISITCLLLALYANELIRLKSIFKGFLFLLLIGTLIGGIRSVIRGDDQIDYFGMVWESTYVFRTFLATLETNYYEIFRLYDDFQKGVFLALPEFIRNIFDANAYPFNLEKWGGDEAIRPLGGHHLWAQFHQAMGWPGIILPPFILAALVLTIKLFKTKKNQAVISVGIFLLGLSLGSGFRDHFYSVFRIVNYWLLFWCIPYALLRLSTRPRPSRSPGGKDRSLASDSTAVTF